MVIYHNKLLLFVFDWTTFKRLGQKFVKIFFGSLEYLKTVKNPLGFTDLSAISQFSRLSKSQLDQNVSVTMFI